MTVLHVASIHNDPFSGVCVAVPQHVMAQKMLQNVGFINVNNEPIDSISCQLPYGKGNFLEYLPAPFCKPDLVIFHEVYIPQYLRMSKILRDTGIPYIVVPHGSLTKEAQSKKWLKKKVGNVLLFNKFVLNAIAIQCLSDSEIARTKAPIRKFIGTNGIQLPRIVKEKFSSRGVRFVFIGRLDPYIKGLDLLLQAIAENKNFLLENSCCVEIYGPDQNASKVELQRMIHEQSIDGLVILNPAVTNSAKEDVFLNSDVFIQTSRTEGMPMGILEALSYGLPCLVTEGTTLGTAILKSDAGWSCAVTAKAIAETMRNAVMEKGTYLNKSINARTLIHNEFMWEAVTKKTIEMYKQLILLKDA